ncbi:MULTISPECIES: hypothetical protein [Halorussus]|uniref:VNG_1110C family protein n=1 Tax=Halorussus TaxID=1070314 RepID=UPI000E213D3E|nr:MULTISPECIES: hypothetical protein [Halorussus]NHN58157.1 hypothetical protein [Halorussus sp. JP-T4]
MPDPATLRDSTQIVIAAAVLEGFRDDLDEQFTLTFFEMNVDAENRTDDANPTADGDHATGDYVRIIGSPVEIKGASEFLSRQGVSVR